MSDPDLHHPPFLHPRRDSYLARPRRMAALLLSLLQAGWFLAFVVAIQTGTPLSGAFALLGLAGIFFIAARTGLVTELALALADRRAGLEYAPERSDILRRALAGLLFPALVLVGGFLSRHDSPLVFAALAALVGCEAFYRLGRFDHWRSPHLPHSLVQAITGRDAPRAIHLLDQVCRAGTSAWEYGALAIAGMAILGRRLQVLRDLAEAVEGAAEKLPAGLPIERARRTLAVIRADEARLADPGSAAESEAMALRVLPVGHPRRLPLALFVATAALDRGEPEGAVKALALLHSRDAPATLPRMLVNWFMGQAAALQKDDTLSERCRRALAEFNSERIARAMNVEDDGPEDDPYRRWLIKARRDLAGEDV